MWHIETVFYLKVTKCRIASYSRYRHIDGTALVVLNERFLYIWHITCSCLRVRIISSSLLGNDGYIIHSILPLGLKLTTKM